MLECRHSPLPIDAGSLLTAFDPSQIQSALIFLPTGYALGLLSGLALRYRGVSVRVAVSVVVFALWSLWMLLTLLGVQQAEAPLFLHALTAAVIAAAHPEAGEFILRFLGKK